MRRKGTFDISRTRQTARYVRARSVSVTPLMAAIYQLHPELTEYVDHLLHYLESTGDEGVKKFITAIEEEPSHLGHKHLCM